MFSLEEMNEYFKNKKEKIVIDYEGIMKLPEYLICNYIINNENMFKNYNVEFLKQFKSINELKYVLYKRTDKNILKWLYKFDDKPDEYFENELYKLKNKHDFYIQCENTKFCSNFIKIILNSFIEKVLIIINNEFQLNSIVDMFENVRLDLPDKIFFEMIEKDSDKLQLFDKDDYTFFITDDLNLIDQMCEKYNLKGKSFLCPINGYNFKQDENGLYVSNNELEIKSAINDFSIAFFYNKL